MSWEVMGVWALPRVFVATRVHIKTTLLAHSGRFLRNFTPVLDCFGDFQVPKWRGYQFQPSCQLNNSSREDRAQRPILLDLPDVPTTHL